MHSISGTPPSDFVVAFARQRQRLLHQTATLLTGDFLVAAPDHVRKLTQHLAASLEELKVAEEELFDQHLRSEAARAEQDRRIAYFKALFDLAPTPLFFTTTDGSIRAVNRAGTDLTTRDAYRLEGKAISGLVPATSRTEFRRQLTLILETGGVSKWCFTLLRHTDIPVRVEAAVNLVPPEVAGSRGLYWNIRPIDDPSKLEGLPAR